MKIRIEYEGKGGWVQYDQLDKQVMISHPIEEVRNTVRHYLTNPREFTMPASNDLEKIGHRQVVQITPSEDTGYIEMALSEMYFNTGVHVNWGYNEDGPEGDNSQQPTGDPDKPINKSFIDYYDIIN